jgi:tetratricopeptide (TPR) repeat protein
MSDSQRHWSFPAALQHIARWGRRDFRIYILGGSAAQGEPYAPFADFGTILEVLFDRRIRGRRISVVNRARSGWAAADVLRDIDNVTNVQPEAGSALVLLYLGNNEFLPYDTVHDLSTPPRPLFDQPTTDATTRQLALDNYRSSIDSIVCKLNAAGFVVIASTIPVNLSDWEPNRSVLGDPSNAAPIRALLVQADEKMRSSRVEQALERYLTVLGIEPGFAIGSKKAGDCYRRLGENDLALAFYQKAVDCDGNPYRETSQQEQILREVCAVHGVPLVDAIRVLREAADDRLIGYNYMWDNCHPTIDGYLRIAEAFAETMAPVLDSKRVRPHVQPSDIEGALGIDEVVKVNVLISRGQYCYRAATLSYDPKPRLERSQHYLDQAAALDPESVELTCSYAVLAALRGDPRLSLSYWRKASQRDMAYSRSRISHPYVVQILRRYGIDDVNTALGGGS